MFNAVVEFAMQLGILYLLVAMFILIDLLLWAVRARRFREAKERRRAERLRNEERRERRKIGERPAIPSRAIQPLANLAGIVIHSAPEKAVFGRRAAV
jgi:hypothetical protein